jgi:D-alanyl-D-alanine carboxypeptidase (penicillin-binding protein 5/6)
MTRVLLVAILLLPALLAAQTPTPAPVPTPAPAPAPTPPPPSVQGSAWLLMDDASGRVLAGANEDTQVEPASITKVMTSYVVSAELGAGKLRPEDEVTISENAWRGGGGGTDGSTSFLPVNSKVRLDDLLRGMIIQSGNDASIALAEHVAGSEEAFAALMNSHAQRLGMTATHFVNSHGLSAPGHVTTARDIARLAQALIHDFPRTTRSTRRRNSPSTASASSTATACCGATRASTASRPDITPEPASALRPRPVAAINA